MLANREIISELFTQDKSFVQLANSVYRFLKTSLTTLSNEDIRSATTLITNLELLKHPNASEESVIFRLTDYIEKINQESEYIIAIEDNLERWMTILIVAASSEKPKDLALEEQQEQEILEEIIINKATYQIERVLWDIKDPSLVNEIISEVKKNLKSNKKFDVVQLVDNIEQLKDDLLGLAQSLSVLKKRDVQKTENKKEIEQFIAQHRNFTKDSCTKIFKKILNPGQESSRIKNFSEIFKKAFKNIETRKNLARRKDKKIAKKIEPAKHKKNLLHSMIHSHSPKENLNIPSFIANNCHIQRESKRLNSAGMRLTEACEKAVIDNPNHNKFRSLVTKVAKPQSINM